MKGCSILFVCHGNICRSPMAEFVLRDKLMKRGLGESVRVDSAATSEEELGNPVHPGTRRMLSLAGIDCGAKTARRLTCEDYRRYDYLVGMDQHNLRNMRVMLGGDPEGKISLLLSFCGENRDVADPWYTGNFNQTWRDVSRGAEGLLRALEARGLEALALGGN